MTLVREIIFLEVGAKEHEVEVQLNISHLDIISWTVNQFRKCRIFTRGNCNFVAQTAEHEHVRYDPHRGQEWQQQNRQPSQATD